MPSAPTAAALDLGSIFNRTWENFKAQAVLCIVGPLLAMIAVAVIQAVAAVMFRATHVWLFSFLGGVACFVVGVWIQMGILAKRF